MVDFSQSINNADMVAGLNHLIQMNASILAELDQVSGLAKTASHVQALKEMHGRHLECLGDTVCILGGGVKERSWRRSLSEAKVTLAELGGNQSLTRSIATEEQKLKAAYARQRRRLNASPEAVRVINQILSDRDAADGWVKSLSN